MSIPFWDEYARVQRQVEMGTARDEQLDALLKRHSDGHPFDLYDCRRRLKNLDRNVGRKFRDRLVLLERNAFWITRPSTVPPVMASALAESRAAVRLAAGDDWDILRETADGDYSTIAQKMDLPVGTLKSRISRCRAKLRGVLVKSYHV